MFSTGYDLRCERFHFAWRKIRFVFAGFGLVDAGNEMRRGLVARRHSGCGRLGKSSPEKVAQKSSQAHEIIGARKLVRGLEDRCQLRRRAAEGAPGTAIETAASAEANASPRPARQPARARRGRSRPGSSCGCSPTKPLARSYPVHWSHGFDRVCPRDTWRARRADCPVPPPYDEEGQADASTSEAAASNRATLACTRYGWRRPT